jgi:hypothetical protein
MSSDPPAPEPWRAALQGETLDFVWLDEEPDDLEIYSECLVVKVVLRGRHVIEAHCLGSVTEPPAFPEFWI